jgi:hypothetical protein
VDKTILEELSQTLIAILIIAGGGLVTLAGNPHSAELIPLMSLVVGFYFGTRRSGNGNGNGNGNGAKV